MARQRFTTEFKREAHDNWPALEKRAARCDDERSVRYGSHISSSHPTPTAPWISCNDRESSCSLILDYSTLASDASEISFNEQRRKTWKVIQRNNLS